MPGCERIVAAISTSIFGIVYAAEPRSVVRNGSTLWQFRGSGLSIKTCGGAVVGHAAPRARADLKVQLVAQPRVHRHVRRRASSRCAPDRSPWRA